MPKVGIELKIDVKKLDKELFYQGKKGTYATLVAFVELDEKDQYGNSGFITQQTPEDDKDRKMPILGNSKVFWKSEGEVAKAPSSDSNQAPNPASDDWDELDDIPF